MNKNSKTICGKNRMTLPDAADHAVREQALEGSGGNSRFHHPTDDLLTRLDPIHEGTRPRVDRLEDDEHDSREDDQAGDAMRQQVVDAVAEESRARTEDAAPRRPTKCGWPRNALWLRPWGPGNRTVPAARAPEPSRSPRP